MKKISVLLMILFVSSATQAATTYTPKGNPKNNCQSETKTADIVHSEDTTGNPESTAYNYSTAEMREALMDLIAECLTELYAATIAIDLFQTTKKGYCDAIPNCSGVKKPIQTASTPSCTAKITIYTDGNDYAVVEDPIIPETVNTQGADKSCTYVFNPTTNEIEHFCSGNPSNLSGYVYSYSAELSGETTCSTN